MLTITLNKPLKEKYTASHHPPDNLQLGSLELNGHLKKKKHLVAKPKEDRKENV